MSDSYLDGIRETLFRVLMDSGVLRPAPVPLQITEVVNGRSFRVVPLGIVWPGSCLYYAAQDPRLERELLVHVYERKAPLDGGVHRKKEAESALSLPVMRDRGWVKPLEGPRPAATAWSSEFRVTAQNKTPR